MTPEEIAYAQGYTEGHQDGYGDGRKAGFVKGYEKAWADAAKVANGWAWVEKLPALNEAPEIPTENQAR